MNKEDRVQLKNGIYAGLGFGMFVAGIVWLAYVAFFL